MWVQFFKVHLLHCEYLKNIKKKLFHKVEQS